MALVSPGVQVTVIDESNYAPTAIGSVAYILLATAENKVAPGGTAYAAGTLPSNAERVYTITSQRELITTFGTPVFKTTSSGAPINGDEQNEYGLLAAYSLLGVSNQVYVQRANVDLGDLAGSTSRPTDPAVNGTYWLNYEDTKWGIYEYNSVTNKFNEKTVLVLNSSTDLDGTEPNANIGNIGAYAVTTVNFPYEIYQKNWDNEWRLIGSTDWITNVPAVVSTKTSSISIPSNEDVYINGTAVPLTTTMPNATVVAAAINSAGPTGVVARVLGTFNLALFTTGDSDATRYANIWGADADANAVISAIGFTPGIYKGPVANVAPFNNAPTYMGANVRANAGRPSGSIWHKTSVKDAGLAAALKRYSSSTSLWNTVTTNDYEDVFNATYGLDPTNGGLNINAGSAFMQYDVYGNATTGMQLWYRANTGATVGTGATVASFQNINGNTFSIISRPSLSSAATTTYNITVTSNSATGVINPVLAADIPFVTAGIDASGKLFFKHSAGGDLVINKGTLNVANVGLSTSGDRIYADPSGDANLFVISNWAPIDTTDYYVDDTAPTTAPANGTRWYFNTPSRVDVMINNGGAWVGYQTLTNDIRGYDLSATDPSGVIISTVKPETQTDNTALVYGDLWLDTSDLENYPKLYRYQSVESANTWVQINNLDNTSTNGIVFADARWGPSGNVNPITDDIPTIASLLTSSEVDLDAPDPDLYPRGILLFNTRASGYNVKEYRSNYFTSAAFPDQTLPEVTSSWVSVSGYDTGGVVPNFGRKAPRGVVVASLKAAIDNSTTIREDNSFFNIMACPGYPELIPNMVNLNADKDNTAFIVGDTPLRLAANGTDISAWADNSSGASNTGEEGLKTVNPYVGIYYPSGQTNDLNGNSVVVPASHAILRAMIKNDTVGYPWLAPAGSRRGVVDNLNAIGYIDAASGRFVSIGVNQGLRDLMYTKKINPLTVLPGAGLLIYGQKTLSDTPSSLDRINVARLVNYLRTQLNIIVRPFLFEPNDPITRNAVVAVVSSLLNDLVAKRGVTDYLVVCDTSNNTPERIARNELYVDVAVQPTKDVEFIYIPIRLKNPGEIQSGNLASATAVGTGA